VLMLRRAIKAMLREQIGSKLMMDQLMNALKRMKANALLEKPEVYWGDSGTIVTHWRPLGGGEKGSFDPKIRAAMSRVAHTHGWELQTWRIGKAIFMDPETDPNRCHVEDLGDWLFHVSPTTNKEMILSQGLTPRTSASLGWRNRVYLADNWNGVESVISDLCYEREINAFTIFKVSIIDVWEHRFHMDMEFSGGCEFVWTSSSISPNAIKETLDIELNKCRYDKSEVIKFVGGG